MSNKILNETDLVNSVQGEATDHEEYIQLENFESNNEPVIRPYKDHTMHLILTHFPPISWKMSEEDEKTFCLELSTFTGIDVIQEDRNFFYFPFSKNETIQSIQKFISTYKQQHGYT